MKNGTLNINRVIFFLNTTLEDRDYLRFGVDIFREEFDILFIDFTKYLYPLVKKSTFSRKKNIKDKYITVEDQDTLSKVMEIINANNDHGILFFDYNYITHKIFKAITSKGLEYSSFMQGTVPVPPKTNVYNNSLKDLFNKIKRGDLLNRLLSRYFHNPNIAKKIYKIKPQKYCLLGGVASITSYSHYALRDNNTEDLITHTLDYNYYLEKLKDRNHTNLFNIRYAVLIDAPGPIFFGDVSMPGIKKSRLTTERFYPSINKLLLMLENEFKVKTVIAGHPHSKHDRYSKYFDRREVIYNKTGELIKHAEFVITRGSTAISFAVLFNKPILFYTTNECEMHQDIRDGILSYASSFKKCPINIDRFNNDIKFEDELYINPDLYTNYMNNYIKMENTLEKNSWLILKKKLLNQAN